MKIIEKKWIVVSNDETLIAKGIPRQRFLVPIDPPDNKRILTYATKAMAENAIRMHPLIYNGPELYYEPQWFVDNLKAIRVTITIESQ